MAKQTLKVLQYSQFCGVHMFGQFSSLCNKGQHYNPVDTRRRFNVYKTSIRGPRHRIDVLQTLKRRRVSTGKFLWTRINGMSHKKYEKIFRSTKGSYFVPLSFLFSVFSQKIWCCCREQEKIISLVHLLGLTFFNVHEILLCKFCLRSMQSIEM